MWCPWLRKAECKHHFELQSYKSLKSIMLQYNILANPRYLFDNGNCFKFFIILFHFFKGTDTFLPRKVSLYSTSCSLVKLFSLHSRAVAAVRLSKLWLPLKGKNGALQLYLFIIFRLTSLLMQLSKFSFSPGKQVLVELLPSSKFSWREILYVNWEISINKTDEIMWSNFNSVILIQWILLTSVTNYKKVLWAKKIYF